MNGAFLSDQSLVTMLLLASALVFVSLGQMVAILVGGLDLSVGPLMGLVVIVLSTFIPEGASVGAIGLGSACRARAGLGVGLANGLLVRRKRDSRRSSRRWPRPSS